MSGRGQRAALPPVGYRKRPVLDAGGLVVRPVSGSGSALGVWDFRNSPGPVQFRRELVAAFALQGRGWGWDSADTYRTHTRTLRQFLKDAAAAMPPITSTGEITTQWWKRAVATCR